METKDVLWTGQNCCESQSVLTEFSISYCRKSRIIVKLDNSKLKICFFCLLNVFCFVVVVVVFGDDDGDILTLSGFSVISTLFPGE